MLTPIGMCKVHDHGVLCVIAGFMGRLAKITISLF
jgi:hypothetical protein